MWFESVLSDSHNHRSVPLKWTLPIGVQFDTLVGLDGKKDNKLPWKLIFHYRGNPLEGELVTKEGKYNPLQAYTFNFMQSLKQSQCLRMGDANEINQFLPKQDETRMLEDGLLRNNYETFWELNDKHLFKHIGDLKRYAVRVLCNNHHTFVTLNEPLDPLPFDSEGKTVTEDSEQFKVWREKMLGVTIGDLLLKHFPSLFDVAINDDGDGQSIEASNSSMEIIT